METPVEKRNRARCAFSLRGIREQGGDFNRPVAAMSVGRAAEDDWQWGRRIISAPESCRPPYRRIQ
jgi:hypothetical protein